MAPLRILIGDDHPLFRRGLKELLCESFAPIEVGEAESGTEMLSLVRNRPWDIAVMDITMPGHTGPELLKELKQARPSLPILIMSTHPEQIFAVRMFRAGARGYLSKTTAAQDLVGAIKTILAGQKYITASAAQELATTLEHDTTKPPHELLSDREFQVFRMLAAGLSVKQIAEELCVSPNTVSTYRVRILDKMNLKTNAGLTQYAIERGLIGPTT
jgi:two-component system invasion response regulator UvrY